MQTYYLNNSGSRWINIDSKTKKKEKLILNTKSGKEVTRTVSFWKSFGNFATARISYKGKNLDVFPDAILDD